MNMKQISKNLGIVTLATGIILLTSCKDANKKETIAPMSDEMHQETMDDTNQMMSNSAHIDAESVLQAYFDLKDALVADNNSKAKDLGASLTTVLNTFDTSMHSNENRNELKKIIEDATEHAKAVGNSTLEEQRKHFKPLSENMTQMIAITGTESKVYEQYCPMYDGGTAWLSKKEEIKNPYYGSQMLTCGKVERILN